MSTTTPTPRETMNRKPVYWGPAGGAWNMDSGFKHKLLCDGPTFSCGLACTYSCTFCYVGAQLMRHATALEAKKDGFDFDAIVIRRKEALKSLKDALFSRGKKKYDDPADTRVVFASPLVDVAGNLELARETIEACKIILENTHWQIRLLSKSTFLPFVARGIPAEFKQRLIFGVSTGTANDRIAGAFEAGAPLVSKRIESIHQLQDEGYRTFGMICPSLPQADGVYDEFSKDMIERLRIDRMEDVWAEPINVRGSSMTKTRDALSEAGFPREAALVESVSGDAAAWEHYARMTFLAHARNIPSKKLKFLQYVTPHTLDWWTPQIKNGAVLLGKAAVHA